MPEARARHGMPCVKTVSNRLWSVLHRQKTTEMNNDLKPDAAPCIGGKYYPRKMAHGWCVAHRITACGATIERFGAKYRTYREAFERAEAMNRAEAEAAGRATRADGEGGRP